MCDCLKKSVEKITKFLVQDKCLTNVIESHYVNTAIMFDKDGGTKIYLPFEIKHIPKKVDGSDGKQKILRTNIFPTYCPFCGEKFEEKTKSTP